MDKQIDKLINHIRDLENRLGEVDNNLRYIKVVQALKHSLDKLDEICLEITKNCSVNIKQSIIDISIQAADSLFMIESVILYWIINMVTDRFNDMNT